MTRLTLINPFYDSVIVLKTSEFLNRVWHQSSKTKLKVFLTLKASAELKFDFNLGSIFALLDMHHSLETVCYLKNTEKKKAQMAKDMTHSKVIFYHKHKFSLLCNSASVIAAI